eukprot:1143348-Pelagomonas_calceolata.AAC.4
MYPIWTGPEAHSSRAPNDPGKVAGLHLEDQRLRSLEQLAHLGLIWARSPSTAAAGVAAAAAVLCIHVSGSLLLECICVCSRSATAAGVTGSGRVRHTLLRDASGCAKCQQDVGSLMWLGLCEPRLGGMQHGLQQCVSNAAVIGGMQPSPPPAAAAAAAVAAIVDAALACLARARCILRALHFLLQRALLEGRLLHWVRIGRGWCGVHETGRGHVQARPLLVWPSHGPYALQQTAIQVLLPVQ